MRLGTRLEVLYYDQLREQLDLDKTVQENVADGNDTVTIGGRPRHVVGYLQDFLFTAERARSPARILSGGERNRLLLARLFTKPSNVPVLDEPTNDLDVETLDLLEELLQEYAGTLLLVSHDREFLNNVVTSTLVLAGGGEVREYVGLRRLAAAGRGRAPRGGAGGGARGRGGSQAEAGRPPPGRGKASEELHPASRVSRWPIRNEAATGLLSRRTRQMAAVCGKARKTSRKKYFP